MPGKTTDMYAQSGGSVLLQVKELAIPFSLLLAKNGIEYLMSKSQKSQKKSVKPAPKKTVQPKKRTQKGGAPEMQQSLTQLAHDIKTLLSEYK